MRKRQRERERDRPYIPSSSSLSRTIALVKGGIMFASHPPYACTINVRVGSKPGGLDRPSCPGKREREREKPFWLKRECSRPCCHHSAPGLLVSFLPLSLLQGAAGLNPGACQSRRSLPEPSACSPRRARVRTSPRGSGTAT